MSFSEPTMGRISYKKQPTMKVSIVTISFNQAKFLERAILSVIGQDYPDVEYIVVDPGSSDGSRDIIERYRARISKIIYTPDNGPADGLNRGFSVAGGEIYGYINADDAYLPGAVTRAVEALKEHPAASAVYANGYMIDEDGRQIRRFISDTFSLRRYAYRCCAVMQQTTFMRSNAFHAIGGFNRNAKVAWDGELLIDLALSGKRFAREDDYWAIFTVHRESLTGSQALKDVSRINRMRLFRKIKGRDYSELDRAYRSLVRAEKWLLKPAGLFVRIVDCFYKPDRSGFIGPGIGR